MTDSRVRRRTLVVSLLLGIGMLGLLVRLFWLQVLDRAWLQNQAEKRWNESNEIPASRGDILDRNGETLASNSVAYTVSVNPRLIHEIHLEQTVSDGLSLILESNNRNDDKAQLSAKINRLVTLKRPNSDKYMEDVEIRSEGWKIDDDAKQQVQSLVDDLKNKYKLKDVGVYLSSSSSRYYPGDSLASQVLGYISKDGKPIGGIEEQYNSVLQGKPGLWKRQTDARGVETPESKDVLVPPVNGKSIELTIDKKIQFMMEEALRKSYQIWHPKSISAIAADPKTMDILAMASMPDYNPNRYWEITDQSAFVNHTISNEYEPGSTFKLVTLAGSIEEGLFHPDEAYESGTIHVPGNTLHDYNTGWGRISFMEGLLRSSNVAFVKLGYERLQDKFLDYVKKFGFGTSTGIELTGEASGVLNMKEPVEFATATFGQGPLAVTTLQQTAAYAAAANGGKLMRPHIFKALIDPGTGNVVQSASPQMIRQVISEKTAEEVKADLEQVVSNQKIGTGKNAYLPGYEIAGKTGTANIVKEGEKTYSKDTWLTSFIGFAPVQDPKIVLAVVADQPDLGGDFHKGGEVAPVVFKEIMSQALPYLGVMPKEVSNTPSVETDPTVAVPDLLGKSISEAKEQLVKLGLHPVLLGKRGVVRKQFPNAGKPIEKNQDVDIVTEDQIGFNDVPDLKGMSLRDVIDICTLLNIPYRVSGDGYVVQQRIANGQDGNAVEFELQP